MSRFQELPPFVLPQISPIVKLSLFHCMTSFFFIVLASERTYSVMQLPHHAEAVYFLQICQLWISPRGVLGIRPRLAAWIFCFWALALKFVGMSSCSKPTIILATAVVNKSDSGTCFCGLEHFCFIMPRRCIDPFYERSSLKCLPVCNQVGSSEISKHDDALQVDPH